MYLLYLIGPTPKWSLADISAAVTEIRNGLSYQKAEIKYKISKSTLHLYSIGKLKLGSRPGPSSVLTTAEEQKLVEYAVEMSHTGYDCTKQKILDMVQVMVEKSGQKNPFVNNRPDEKW